MGEFLQLGRHFICELSGCEQTILSDNDLIRTSFLRAARDSGLSIVGEGRSDFNPHGFTYYLLLGESHASVHVWPEYGYSAVDLFTCDSEIDADLFFTALQNAFRADHATIQLIERGCLWAKDGDTENLIPISLHRDAINSQAQPSSDSPWGWHLVLDLYLCDPYLIGSYDVIEAFVIDLCELINMRRFGDPIIERFGDDPDKAGYSMLQLIETSNLSGHFAKKSGAAYLDIFSCKEFDPLVAAEFCAKIFQAKRVSGRFIRRD